MPRVTKGMLAGRIVLFAAIAAALPAQIGYPGGRYPGGGGSPYPGGPTSPYPGGSGGPMPGGRGRGRTSDPKPSKGGKNSTTVPAITATGILRLVAGNQFVIEADDHRIISYKVGDKMTVQREGKPVELSTFATADHLTVDAVGDDQGYFTATAVTFNMPGTAREREEASKTWDLPDLSAIKGATPSAAKSEDEDQRPTLRRKSEGAAAQPTPGKSESASATPGSTGSKEPAAEPEDNRPTTSVRPSDPALDADDPGRPQVRRGRPAPRLSAGSAEPEPRISSPDSPPSLSGPRTEPPPEVVPIQEDPLIMKARDAAEAYTGTLPNFFCRQLTTRYESDRPKDGWQALDTISADLAYENGHESYTNIRVGNKEQKGSMNDVGGSWSTGEFASVLDDLLAPGTAAVFRRGAQDTIAGRSTTIFKFEIPRERSHWRVSIAAQIYYPAIRGTVWIDRETSRVLRLEMESRNMPLLFPLVKVEEAVDYDLVRLATVQPYLLPTVSEVLSCYQGSSHCTRNRIEFRNYRKFGAESGITFEDK